MAFFRNAWRSLKIEIDASPIHEADENKDDLGKELYHNEDFKLIHVEEEEEGSFSMKLITPGDHYSVRRDVQSEGFYTISHFWGDTALCRPWTNHGILNDDGDPVEVMIRPEKCETILALLQANPGYWWIDLFCAQPSTPAVIMGDIFLHCNRCFVLADCKPSNLLDAATTMKDVLKTIESADGSHQKRIDRYVERLRYATGSKDMSWQSVFDDLFGDDNLDLCALAHVLNSQWFTRVSTLQEFALPPKLSILSETLFSHALLERSDLDRLFSKMLSILHGALNVFMDPVFPGYRRDIMALHMLEHRSLDKECALHISTNFSISCCYYTIKKVHEIQLSSLRLDATDTSNSVMHPIILHHYSNGLDLLPLHLASLAESPRMCADPSDYIYGVSGLLGIDIPRTSNRRLTWVAFKNELLKRAPYLTSIPRYYNFDDVTDMQSFYKFIPRDVLDERIDELFKAYQ
ncbi:hypothetical protein BX666DRAFT_1939387 [Dichotomocladium elegans]|nr:hypothetical protein BX666DRAFT_1939387 [Dichotomocladium elegans]